MSRKVVACAFPCLLAIALGSLTSCRPPKSPLESAPVVLQPTWIDYVDSEGFDALFETSLTNQDPIIVVRTGRTKPDWEGRLNAWIAAWNRGAHKTSRRGVADEAESAPVIRGQSPMPNVTVDGESIREFRFLVEGLLDRIDEAAQNGTSWWVEERPALGRIALLKPYNLRFHVGDDEKIQLVFFHGGYAEHYLQHLRQLMRDVEMTEAKWSRSVECSGCKKMLERDRVDRLISQEESR